MGSKRSQCIFAMNDKSSCIGVCSPAVTLHESQKESHFQRSVCGLYIIILSLFKCLLKCQVTCSRNPHHPHLMRKKSMEIELNGSVLIFEQAVLEL